MMPSWHHWAFWIIQDGVQDGDSVFKHAYFRKFKSDFILKYMFVDVLEAN